MSVRYVVEAVARQPALRRIRDTKKNKYLKQPHGDDRWSVERATQVAAELNAVAAGRSRGRG